MTGTRAERPVRIANCSGSHFDPGVHMYTQALHGNVDVITGDYLAEMNLALNAVARQAGNHPGYEQTALDGLMMSLELLNEKRIKVVINGGALNPKALAEKVQAAVEERKLDLKVAWVSGDDLMSDARELLAGHVKHFDSQNSHVKLPKDMESFFDDPNKPLVSCNAYLGARAINRGLEMGADIIICGRVSDASPVIGAAQWWHKWSDISYDELAGALIAGHLIECSTYSTGANFAGFYQYELSELLNLGLPIAEISASGECVITIAQNANGYVTTNIITCQLLYEIQGDIYLNSCVKADISNIKIEQAGKNRVLVTGVKGYPPPATTKLATYYQGGWKLETAMNATGYATKQKYDLFEMQIKSKLQEMGALEKFEVLEFQRAGVPERNPQNQLAATTYCRVFAQAEQKETLNLFLKAYTYYGMQHFAGCCASGDQRTIVPTSYLAYYPGLIEQSRLYEEVHFLGPSPVSYHAGNPPVYEALLPRRNYEPTNPVALSLFGPTVPRQLGDIALARSGDKGGNINVGIFVLQPEHWDWLRSFLSSVQMKELVGEDWREDFYIERVEFPHLRAVHFVIYGILGRGVTSSSRLDSLGKAFGEYIRAKEVQVPAKFFK